MQRLKENGPFAALVLCAAALGVWLWGFGGAMDVSRWAASEQREVQNGLAGALRALRAGEVWALFSLLALCFTYGFVHAAGPGHGKLLMGGYAVGTDVPRARIIGLTLAGALGQAVTAVVLVSGGAALFGLGRAQMTELADQNLAGASAIAIALVGVWLVARGLRRWQRMPVLATPDGGVCASCGHAHGPTPDQMTQAVDWQSGLAVVAAVAVRPCTGALFLLILTFSMGLHVAGLLGVLAMALGTAVLTLAVALGAWHIRGGLARRMEGAAGLRTMAGLEIAAGLIVAVLSLQTALRLF